MTLPGLFAQHLIPWCSVNCLPVASSTLGVVRLKNYPPKNLLPRSLVHT